MKTIKELNEKWYWRFIKVIYIFFVFLAIIGSFVIPIGVIFFESPIEFLSKNYKKDYEENGKRYIEEKEYLKIFREKNPDFEYYNGGSQTTNVELSNLAKYMINNGKIIKEKLKELKSFLK